MENVMRVLWHLNAELSCVYEVNTLAESLLREAEAAKEQFHSLAPGSGEAEFAVCELNAAVERLQETEAVLRDLRHGLEQIIPNEGASGK